VSARGGGAMARDSSPGSPRPPALTRAGRVPKDGKTGATIEIPRKGSGIPRMFVDRVTIFVKGGDGGRGMSSFRREKYVPKGGPDGGDGGDGGDVIIRAVAGTDSLAAITHQKHWRAAHGGPGGSANCHGRRGDDLVIEVPPGTVIRDRDRGHVLKDL